MSQEQQNYKRGDVLIIVHEPQLEGYAIGDRFTFDDYGSSCGFIKVKEINLHISPSLVEKFKDGKDSPEQINDNLKLGVLRAMQRFALLPTLTQHNGLMPVETFCHEFKSALNVMGLYEEFHVFAAGNHKLQPFTPLTQQPQQDGQNH